MRRLIALLALLVALPASAAAARQEMVASAAFTSSGNSSAFPIPSCTNLFVGIDMTTGSTVTALDMWLQASDDGGTTWYDYPADITLKDASTAAAAGAETAASGTQSTRDIVDNYASTSAQRFVGIYRGIASDRIRLKWVFTGTSFTFSASYVCK